MMFISDAEDSFSATQQLYQWVTYSTLPVQLTGSFLLWKQAFRALVLACRLQSSSPVKNMQSSLCHVSTCRLPSGSHSPMPMKRVGLFAGGTVALLCCNFVSHIC